MDTLDVLARFRSAFFRELSLFNALAEFYMSRDVCPLSSKQQKYLEDHPRTCKWLVTPIRFGRGTTRLRGLTITMVINHVSKSWDDPPSMSILITSVQEEILPSKFPKKQGQIQKHMAPKTYGPSNWTILPSYAGVKVRHMWKHQTICGCFPK